MSSDIRNFFRKRPCPSDDTVVPVAKRVAREEEDQELVDDPVAVELFSEGEEEVTFPFLRQNSSNNNDNNKNRNDNNENSADNNETSDDNYENSDDNDESSMESSDEENEAINDNELLNLPSCHPLTLITVLTLPSAVFNGSGNNSTTLSKSLW